jgi:predicted nucleic acid-binding protein
MILVDTSVWIDHFRDPDPSLSQLLNSGKVLTHPFVIGELSMGSRPKRNLLNEIIRLKQALMATDAEVLHLVAKHKLHGIGIGYLDAHLLASATMSPNTSLWTKDLRLAAAAGLIAVQYRPHLN